MLEIEKHLIICGIREGADYLAAGKIAGVVTASSPRLLVEAEENQWAASAQPFLDQIKNDSIPHYYSHLFHSDEARSASLRLLGPSERILKEIHETSAFAHKILSGIEDGKYLMIHCMNGWDRSAFIALYLLRQKASSMTEALQALQRLRPWARLNIYSKFLVTCFGEEAREVKEYRQTILFLREIQDRAVADRRDIGALFKNTGGTTSMPLIFPFSAPGRCERYGIDLFALRS